MPPARSIRSNAPAPLLKQMLQYGANVPTAVQVCWRSKQRGTIMKIRLSESVVHDLARVSWVRAVR
jgi:hypothetical protein